MKKVIPTPTQRRCSLKGCRNLKATLFARSSDSSNSVWLCNDCIKEIYNIIFPETLTELAELKNECEKLKNENEELKIKQPITIQNAQIPDSGTIGVVNSATSTTTSKSSGKKK